MSTGTSADTAEQDAERFDVPYVDLHAHMQFSDFDLNREEIISNMRAQNVIAINVGTTYETSKKGVKLAQAHPDVFRATVGTHPVHAVQGRAEESRASDFEDFFTNENTREHVVGIGECGLDYFRREGDGVLTEDDLRVQEDIFQQQIDWSKKHGKPLMLHVRDSYGKTLELLSKNFIPDKSQYRGNAHFFVGTVEEAQAFLDLGFSISFTGVITFVPAYRALVEAVPLDRMFAETDSPYVSPVPFRGRKNNPVQVIEIYKKIAEIKGVPLRTVVETLHANARKYWL